MTPSERQPLIRQRASAQEEGLYGRGGWLHNPLEQPTVQTTRERTRKVLDSKFGHYFILFMVGVDVVCIFADFLISLYLAEHECGGNVKEENRGLHEAKEALEIVSLVFSCLFMVELLASVWAFGLKYFKSWFHCLDSTVILAGFIVDVAERGVIEEAGSVIVILRLWRVFKIVEEVSNSAQEQIDTFVERIEELEQENQSLKRQLEIGNGARQIDQGHG